MSFSLYIKAWFGFLVVEQQNGYIYVKNVKRFHKDLSKFIQKEYGYTKLHSILFALRSSDIVFPDFFLLEFVNVLQRFKNSATVTYSIKRVIDNILEQIKEKTWANTVLINRGESLLDFSKLDAFKLTLMDQQMAFLQLASNHIPRYRLRGYLLGSPPGTGKAQPLTANVLTPSGFVPMGSLKVGDKVIAPDGISVNINNIYPQGNRFVYKIILEDGRYTRADIEHLWKVIIDDTVTVITTSKIRRYIAHDKDVYLPTMDYSKDNNMLSSQEADALVEAVTNIRLSLEQHSGQSYNSFLDLLKQNNIQDAHDQSYNYRKLFIYTLLNKEISLSNSKFLKLLPNMDLGIGSYIFKLLRSVGYICNDKLTYIKKSDKIKIKRIVLESAEECQCIEVDHPDHLYITDNYIVTHNTFMDLAFVECLPNSASSVKIIISPKNAINDAWESHLLSIYKRPVTYWISNMDINNIPLDKEFYVFHYERLDKACELAYNLRKINKSTSIIVDESHNFNVLETVRSRQLIELCNIDKRTYTIFASGTPFKALGSEMMTCLSCIDPYFTPTVSTLFKKVFGGVLPTNVMYILRDRINTFMFKVSKAEVLTDVEPPIVNKVYVKVKDLKPYLTKTVKDDMLNYIETALEDYKKKMVEYDKIFFAILKRYEQTLVTANDKAKYNRYIQIITYLKKNTLKRSVEINQMLMETKAYEEQYILSKLNSVDKKTFKEIRSIIKSLISKVMGEALGRVFQKRRAEAASELARCFDIQSVINNALSKTLIYSNFTAPMIELNGRLINDGFSPHLIYAKTNNKLISMINDFNTKEEVNPLIATFKSLSTAVHLTTANTVVMYDVPFRQYLYDQTISRVYRKGQTKQVYIYELYIDSGNEPNITTRTSDILNWSREQIAILIGEEFSGKDMDQLTNTLDGE